MLMTWRISNTKMTTKNSHAERRPQLHHYNLPDGVLAFSTTRLGGVGTGQYAEFNVNDYCGDSPAAVVANRQALCQALSLPTSHLVFPHQTHGVEIRQMDHSFFSLSPTDRASMLEGVDALITDMKDVCIGVSTADCIPILLYDPVHKVVAAIHAGWRGTVARIAVSTICRMGEVFHTDSSDLYAVIGPGISLSRFEVGDEVYEQFKDAGFDMSAIACRYSKWHINLPLCNRMQLLEEGLREERMTDSGICTYDHVERFFSARRLGIQSGRILTAIMMKQ